MDPEELVSSSTSDVAIYSRQRRNVMVVCTVVLAVYVLDVQYQAVTIFGLHALSPWNFDVAWAFLTWYFVWRMSQCEKPYSAIEQPTGYYRTFIRELLPTKSELVECRAQALGIANEKLTTTRHVQSRNPQTGEMEEWHPTEVTFSELLDLHPSGPVTIYKLGFSVKTLDPNNSHPVVLDRQLLHTSWVARRAWAKAYVAASWSGKYFTEYLLPYLLGFTCITYLCIHHLILNL